MNMLNDFLNNKLTPWGLKLSGNKYIAAIRDTFISFMPFLIIGSIFIIIQDFPLDAWQKAQSEIFGDWFNQFIILPKRVTYDIMSLYIAAGMGYRLSRNYKKTDPLTAAFLSLATFVLLTPIATTIDVDGTIVEVAKVITVGGWFGTNGILVALFVGIVVTEAYRYFIERNITFKMPEGVPPAVNKAFAALIPGFVILVVGLLINYLFRQTSYGNIHQFVYTFVGYPIQSLIANNVIGAVLTTIFISLFWFIGINGGSVVNGILRPFWVPLQEANLAAVEAGKPIPNIITEQFFDMVWIGGVGATLGVVIYLAFRAKSKQYKEIGKVSLFPGLFNINEPVMFGVPVVLNPYFLIPLLLGPVAITLTNYTAMALNLVARPTGVIVPWATPPIIQGFLITGHWSGAVMQLIDIIIALAIWAPFIKAMDKQLDKEEQAAIAAKGA